MTAWARLKKMVGRRRLNQRVSIEALAETLDGLAGIHADISGFDGSLDTGYCRDISAQTAVTLRMAASALRIHALSHRGEKDFSITDRETDWLGLEGGR